MKIKLNKQKIQNYSKTKEKNKEKAQTSLLLEFQTWKKMKFKMIYSSQQYWAILNHKDILKVIKQTTTFQITILINNMRILVKSTFQINKMIKILKIKQSRDLKIKMKIKCLKVNNLYIHKLKSTLKKWVGAGILLKIKSFTINITNKIKAISK